ncbi:hypothetical protein QE419_002885 [Brevundimonas vesicularis]|uniref:hypothetical protein n=1 Tax=Brevundimonas vesicularis TaxID=41276 RepID=UPI0027875A9B|nr:hypothetical protein [Brevundimonas vesicularis]MDQ1194119.1 hypothetical protein [Brevundimonas vesicularis]
MLLLSVLIILGLTLADEGVVGTALRKWLVETPARFLAGLSRGRTLGLGLVALMGVTAVMLFETEGVRLFSMAAPDMVAWVLMFDVTVLFDIVVLAVSLRAVAGWRGLIRHRGLMQGLARRLIARIKGARSRGRRVSRPRPPRSPSGDPEPEPAYAFA